MSIMEALLASRLYAVIRLPSLFNRNQTHRAKRRKPTWLQIILVIERPLRNPPGQIATGGKAS